MKDISYLLGLMDKEEAMKIYGDTLFPELPIHDPSLKESFDIFWNMFFKEDHVEPIEFYSTLNKEQYIQNMVKENIGAFKGSLGTLPIFNNISDMSKAFGFRS